MEKLLVPAWSSGALSGKSAAHMSFRNSNNQADQWRAFCAKHNRYVSQLPRLNCVLATAGRFDQFLQSGVYADNKGILTIMSLTDDEWPPFSLFVDQYSIDWQSYFTDTMYVAYYREHDSRHWKPATSRFNRNDLRIPKLIIHFWAKWDAHDRNMDANLRSSTERFRGCVEFRSLDIDIPQLQDVIRYSGIANVPALAFYTHGHVNHILIGVRESQAIEDYIETWLAE